MIYTSKHNDLIKQISSLKDKKSRDEQGRYIVEGIKMVREAIRYNKDIVYFVVALSKSQEYNFDTQKMIIVSDDVFKFISDEKTPQGVLAVLNKDNECQINSDRVIILDRIQDPGNMGTIIRSAVAFGYNDICLINSTDPYSGKAVRSSMSGIYSVKFHFIEESDVVKNLSSYQIISADMDGENLDNFVPSKRHAIIIGNEANGISDYLMSISNAKVRINMLEGIESLNAGVAGSIMMYKLGK